MAKVILVCGGLCCGKTTYAHRLRKERKAIVLSMDEVMLALWDPYLGDEHEKYASRTEKYLLQKALEIVDTGIDVVLDWGPWTRDGRSRLKTFFVNHDINCELHAIRLNDTEWRKRIERRNQSVQAGEAQAYHVDEGLLQKFLERYEEPAADETDIWVDA